MTTIRLAAERRLAALLPERQATTARVEVRVRDGALHVAVRDDGRSGVEWVPGVGISSMRERAQQVGGTLRASATGSGGLVETSLPLGPG
ncbi:hypothetical protein [Nocardioides baculatus]|uniref:Histidine kinase/HSP90-like ATPase domain-containing protein n=1 Tax=Nocardioides baculatus TaxID=2801337 RepID=A0ABS1L513_9ACTN|nr:hypothetical protein [Nocardioides baculatus]MBL0746775.1 hypothetical protein [Nocardioides baculatus]